MSVPFSPPRLRLVKQLASKLLPIQSAVGFQVNFLIQDGASGKFLGGEEIKKLIYRRNICGAKPGYRQGNRGRKVEGDTLALYHTAMGCREQLCYEFKGSVLAAVRYLQPKYRLIAAASAPTPAGITIAPGHIFLEVFDPPIGIIKNYSYMFDLMVGAAGVCLTAGLPGEELYASEQKERCRLLKQDALACFSYKGLSSNWARWYIVGTSLLPYLMRQALKLSQSDAIVALLNQSISAKSLNNVLIKRDIKRARSIVKNIVIPCALSVRGEAFFNHPLDLSASLGVKTSLGKAVSSLILEGLPSSTSNCSADMAQNALLNHSTKMSGILDGISNSTSQKFLKVDMFKQGL